MAKLKKGNRGGSQDESVKMIDMNGRAGAKRIQKINQELSEYYEQQKKLKRD